MNAPNSASPKSLSILMLAFNGGQDAIESIKSLSKQRDFIDQIFISDNASTDKSPEIIENQIDNLGITHVKSSENLGFAGGFNHLFEEALKKSNSDYFLILNNDTEAEADFLQNLLREAEPNRIVSPMILWYQDKDTVIQCAGDFDQEMIKMNNLYADKSQKEVPPGVHQVEQTDGCCFLIHRSWLEKGFRFNPDLFIYFEDVDLFLNLTEAGLTFHYVSDSVLYHKEYGASGGREKPSPFRNYYFYRNRFYIAKRLHSGLKKWRVYWRLWRLAQEKYNELAVEFPDAAGAIHRGIKDFFLGRMGRNLTP